MNLQLSPVAESIVSEAAVTDFGKLSVVGDIPVEPTMDSVFPNGVRDRSMAECCLSGLWLLHNHLDRSHAISQDVSSAEGSFWHGIMHRMEGDYWNSKYWFRRVGEHDCFNDIVARIGDDEQLREADLGFVSEGHWDPMEFVDFCERADEAGGDLLETKRRVALLEWQALFEHCWSRANG